MSLSVKDKLKGLGKNSPVKSILSLTENQRAFISRDLSEISEDEIWKEAEELRGTAVISFMELGRRLVELQERYSKRGNGSFQKRCQDKGFKKTEVETIISKYQLYEEEKKNGCSATELLFISNQLQEASQRTTAEIKKATEEVRKKFYSGEIKKASEIKEAAKAIKDVEIIDAEIVDEKNNGCTATEKKDNSVLLERKKELKEKIAKFKEEIKEATEELFNIDKQLENANNLKLTD